MRRYDALQRGAKKFPVDDVYNLRVRVKDTIFSGGNERVKKKKHEKNYTR